MNLTQRQLEHFIAAATSPTLSRAAQACHLSQPAFSRALQALEATLGVTLFDRSTRRLALSPQGERLLPLARRLLDDLQNWTRTALAPPEAVLGTVTLAVGTAFGGSVLPLALRRFQQRHPGVQVRVIDDNSRGITSRVAEGSVDLGVGSIVGPGTALTGRTLLTAPLGVIVAPQAFGLPDRPRLDQLRRLPLVKEAEDTSVMSLLRGTGSPWADAMEGGVEVSSLALQLSLVAAGLGASVVSALGAAHPLARGLAFVPLRPRTVRHVQLLQRKGTPAGAAAAALAEELVAAAAGLRLGRPAVR